MNTLASKHLERWVPWGLLLLVIVIWQLICSAFNVSEYIFPSPARIAEQMAELLTPTEN